MVPFFSERIEGGGGRGGDHRGVHLHGALPLVEGGGNCSAGTTIFDLVVLRKFVFVFKTIPGSSKFIIFLFEKTSLLRNLLILHSPKKFFSSFSKTFNET